MQQKALPTGTPWSVTKRVCLVLGRACCCRCSVFVAPGSGCALGQPWGCGKGGMSWCCEHVARLRPPAEAGALLGVRMPASMPCGPLTLDCSCPLLAWAAAVDELYNSVVRVWRLNVPASSQACFAYATNSCGLLVRPTLSRQAWGRECPQFLWHVPPSQHVAATDEQSRCCSTLASRCLRGAPWGAELATPIAYSQL